MSCCGSNKSLLCGSKGEFSPVNDTWTRKTSLNMNDWDPYPELSGPMQNYKGCASGGACGGCGGHSSSPSSEGYVRDYSPNTKPSQFDQLLYTWNTQPRYSMEHYNYRQDYILRNPTNYDALDKTWAQQSRYQL